jgi:hypothetical protein
MASQRQIDANRRNAQKSTGPRTPEGKAASSFNALRHGFASEHYAVRSEDKKEFDDIRDEFMAEHQPTTPTEFALVEQIALSYWRLRRLRKSEAAFCNCESAFNTRSANLHYDKLKLDPVDHLAFSMARDLRSSSSFLTNLSRYEYRLERSFYKALHELERIRRERAQTVPAEPEPDQPQPVEPPRPTLVLPRPEPQIGFVSPITPETPPAPLPTDTNEGFPVLTPREPDYMMP